MVASLGRQLAVRLYLQAVRIGLQVECKESCCCDCLYCFIAHLRCIRPNVLIIYTLFPHLQLLSIALLFYTFLLGVFTDTLTFAMFCGSFLSLFILSFFLAINLLVYLSTFVANLTFAMSNVSLMARSQSD